MKFQFTFAISPSGVFGVPEEGRTVLPAGTEYIGDAIDTVTWTRAGYGSLPEYRRADEAIALPLSLGNVQGQIQDNFMSLQVEVNSYTEAYSTVTQTLEKLLQHLSVSQSRQFTYQPLTIISEDGKVYPIPTSFTIASVTHYHLEQLKRDIQEAETFCTLQDTRLERALQYFDHALFLYELRTQVVDVFSRHYQKLIAAVFLNLWKAVSTIVGDPNTDKKDYQRRYKKFGFDYAFFTSKIELLRNMRNNYDVAHYSLDDNLLSAVEANFGAAQNITVEVLRRYREYIRNKSAQ